MSNANKEEAIPDEDYLECIYNCIKHFSYHLHISMYKEQEYYAPESFLTEEARNQMIKTIKNFHDYLFAFCVNKINPVELFYLNESLSYVRLLIQDTVQENKGKVDFYLFNLATWINRDFKFITQFKKSTLSPEIKRESRHE